jgi:hypothetical protein
MSTFIGVWVWGTVTAILAGWVILVILWGRPESVYVRIKDSATALGAVIAASALAWSYFYQTATDKDELIANEIQEIKQVVEGIRDRMK